MKFTSDTSVLEKLGLEVEKPDSGCCGMAGSFGYEAGERYRVSQACGERVILPKVREADKDTLILADGFSCREQLQQATGREPLHLAQVLRMAQQHAATAEAVLHALGDGLARDARLREVALGAGVAMFAGAGVALATQVLKGNGRS
jgi:Fe-S oxidoreductase